MLSEIRLFLSLRGILKAFSTTWQSLMKNEIAEFIPSEEIATVAFSNLATLRGLLHFVRNDKRGTLLVMTKMLFLGTVYSGS